MVARYSPLKTLVPALLAGLAGAAHGAPPAFTVGSNFIGSTAFIDSARNPPDTDGAVGPAHFVELINGRYSVYRKTDGLRVQTSSLDQFFINGGVTIVGSFSFDPRVLFDKFSNRWYALAVDNPGLANSFIVAVSNTSDPTQGWLAFKIDTDPDDQQWCDFPTFGVNSDSVVCGGNMFAISSGSFFTAFAVIPKASLLAGNIVGATSFLDFDSSVTGSSVQPVVSLDNAAGRSLFSSYNTGAGQLKRTLISGPLNAPTIGGGAMISTTARSGPPLADQPGPKTNLATVDSRFTGSVVQMNGMIWAARCIASGSNDAVEWFRINAATNTVAESGLIGGSTGTTDYYFPSIAVNQFGDVVIGMASSNNETRYPGSYAVVGHFDGASTQFSAPVELKAGVSDVQRLDGSGRNRWGDYSATTVDPQNARSFWTIQEWVSATDVWSTQVTEIRITPPCPGDITGDNTVGTADLTTLLGAFGTCPGDPLYDGLADLDHANPCIGTADLVTLLGLFGTSCPGARPTQPALPLEIFHDSGERIPELPEVVGPLPPA